MLRIADVFNAGIKGVPGILLLALTFCTPAGREEIPWLYEADLDRDGALETVKVLDLNGNQAPDRLGDLHLTAHGDSLFARLWDEFDYDLDGEPDQMKIYLDRNGDGRVDTTEGWLWRCLDLDDDGICDDLDSDLHELDLVGRGFIQQRIRYQDFDRDGDPDLRADYPNFSLYDPTEYYRDLLGNRCMRETWRGMFSGFGAWVELDEDDDNHFPPNLPSFSVWEYLDADGSGTFQMRVRRPPESTGMGLEGRRTTGEVHRWYDLNHDGFTDMHLRDYGPGLMRWSFDWDGDAAARYKLEYPRPDLDAYVDYDLAFHALAEKPKNWGPGDQLKLWDFLAGFGVSSLWSGPGSAYEFGSFDFVPSSSAVYYTLHAPWRAISLNWLENQQDSAGTKDVASHRLEGIWGYYFKFEPRMAFIGSRREFDRDADSGFRLYFSAIDSLYHLYEAEDGIFYRDPDCRRNNFYLWPTPDNIRRYVREIITYSDSDNDGFFDTFGYDRDLDGRAEELISRPGDDQAEITDMTRIWRCGEALDSLYRPSPDDTLPSDFQLDVQWQNTAWNLEAQVKLTSSRPLEHYELRLRAEEHVDYNILCSLPVPAGAKEFQTTAVIPRAQFILPGITKVTALLVNGVGRIVASRPVGEVEVKPLNSPSLQVGFYRLWLGSPAGDHAGLRRTLAEGAARIGESLKLEVGVELLTGREMTLVFEPFLTDSTEQPRWPLGQRIYRAYTGELLLEALVETVPFGDETLAALNGRADTGDPLPIDYWLNVRESGSRVYIPPDRDFRPGFRLYIDNRLIEDRILYYDKTDSVPQTIRLAGKGL